jgi:hypothetical protein
MGRFKRKFLWHCNWRRNKLLVVTMALTLETNKLLVIAMALKLETNKLLVITMALKLET